MMGSSTSTGGNANITVAASSSSTITASLGLANSLYGYNSFTVGNSASLTVSGFLNGVSGSTWGGINKLGAGTLILSYPGNGYGQGMELNGGTVIFSNGGLHANVSGSTGYLADFQANSTLQWATGNAQDISAGSQVKIDDGIVATLNPGGNTVVLGTSFTLGSNKTGGLAVAGSGVLAIAAAEAYTGADHDQRRHAAVGQRRRRPARSRPAAPSPSAAGPCWPSTAVMPRRRGPISAAARSAAAAGWPSWAPAR